MKILCHVIFLIITAIGLLIPIAVNAEEVKNEVTKIESISTTARQLHVRSLAASCAACHGTNGNSVGDNAKLAGKDKVDFVTKMFAFKSGERIATVMHHHAKGLNAQEIADLAEYFNKQVPHSSAALVPQILYVSGTINPQ